MRKGYRNTSFLTELLINILVFSIACAALAGVFAQASLVARQTREENAAHSEVWAVLETGKVRGYEQLEGFEPQPDGRLVCGYDEEWTPTPPEGAAYTICLRITDEATGAGTLRHVDATAQTAEGRQLCHFTAASYLPQGGAAA